MGEKAKILILGTYHFAYRGEHLIKSKGKDADQSQKQKEIAALVEALAKFNPNKIAVEARKEKETEINTAYYSYCNEQPLEKAVISEEDEVVQIAFRLARKLNHSQVYPLDYPVSLPIEDMLAYAEHNDKKVYGEFMERAQELGKQLSKILSNKTITDIFRYLNSPEKAGSDHSNLYLYPAQIGAGDNYCGGNVLAEWYKRNVYIFSNLQAISNSGDRILVLCGADHLKILRDFVKDYNDFELIEALDYLA